MEEKVKMLIKEMESLKRLEDNEHIVNEKKIKQNNDKISTLKAEINQNESFQKSFEPDEKEYQEFSNKNEEIKKQIENIEKENRILNSKNQDIRARKANRDRRQKIEQKRQEIKNELNEKRKIFIKNRNANVEEKINELKEKQQRLKNDIEAGERGVKIEEQVAERIGNDEALRFKKNVLEKRVKESQKNEAELQIYNELFEIDDIFKEIDRLDLAMKEIDNLSFENTKIDMSVFVGQQEAKIKQQEEEAKRKQQEEEVKRKQQEEEAKRKQQEEEAKRRQQEEEAKRRQQEEEAKRRQQEEEAKRKQQEEEAKRKQQEKEAKRKQQEEEAKRKQQEEEAKRKQQEEEAKRKQPEEEAKRKQQEEEAKRKQKEEEDKKYEEESEPVEDDNKETKFIRLRFNLVKLEVDLNLLLQDLNECLPKDWEKTEEGQKIRKELLDKFNFLKKGWINKDKLSDEAIINLNKFYDELPFSIDKEDFSEETIDKIKQQLKELESEQEEQMPEEEENQDSQPVKLNFDKEKLKILGSEFVEQIKSMGLPKSWNKTAEGQKIEKEFLFPFNFLKSNLEKKDLSEEEIIQLNKIYESLKNFEILKSLDKEKIDKMKQELGQSGNEQDSNKYEKEILDDPEVDPNRVKRLPLDIEVNLGRKGYVIYQGKKYKISKGEMKGFTDLGIFSIIDMIKDCGIEIKEATLLKEALGGEYIDYAVINGIISANKMNNEIKVNILNTYLSECLRVKDCIKKSKFEEAYAENKCNITYNLKDLSRVGGMSEEEKNEFLMNIGKVQRFNMGKIQGEYKPSFLARIMAKLKGRDLKLLGQYEEEVGRVANRFSGKRQTAQDYKSFIKSLRDQIEDTEIDFGTYEDKKEINRNAGKTVLNYYQKREVEEVVKEMSQKDDGRG